MGKRKKTTGATTSEGMLEGLRGKKMEEATSEPTSTVEERDEAELISARAKREEIERLIPAGIRPAPTRVDGEVPMVLIDDDVICPSCDSDDTSFVLEKTRFELFMTALFLGKASPPAIPPTGPWTCYSCGVAFMTPKARQIQREKLLGQIAVLEEKLKGTTPNFVTTQ
jgi:hypothetical protein